MNSCTMVFQVIFGYKYPETKDYSINMIPDFNVSLYSTTKYLLHEHILGVLTHTTAWDQD